MGSTILTAIEAFLKIYLSVEKWQTHRDLLPMKNGVLNVKSLELLPYSPDNRFRWQLPFDYDRSAKMNVIRSWLWEMTSKDIEAVNTIRAFIKIALAGGNLQKFLEIVGQGGTGKSTLIRLFIMLIGESNHAATDLKNLEGNRFEAATLYGKRLAIISDSSRYGGEVSVLKALTGGDPIRLERKNQQQSGAFVFDGVVVIASNEAIQSADYTSGLARRRLPVLFNTKVTDADKEKWRKHGGIEKAMSAELPALLNWVLAMSDNDMNAVIGGISGEMTKAQRRHYCETNKLASWLDDNVIISKNTIALIGGSTTAIKDDYEIKHETESNLYPNYERWCKNKSVNPIAVQRFSNSLLDVCEHVKIDCKRLSRSNKGARLQGLELRTDCQKHNQTRTPITKELLNSDDECLLSDDTNPPVSLASVDGADSDDINPVVDFEAFSV